MNRKSESVRVLVGTAAFAYALYAMTLPEGLPWSIFETFAGAWMVVALAAGLLGALVTRYLGWRCGVAVAIIFTCVPEVWNRAILGERGMAIVAFAICGLWLLNAILLWVFRKAREAKNTAPMVATGDATAHDEAAKRGKVNNIAAWSFLGIAGLYASLSILLHDYKMGELASIYARGIVEEASGRIIVMNGVADRQIEREVEEFAAISLRNNDATYRTNMVAWVKREWPSETNLYLAAQVSGVAFVNVAAKAHPERFYFMNGKSTTFAGWEKRWEEFRQYLKSTDPFVEAARLAFGYEGNQIANEMLDKGGKANEESAWQLYKRIYKEINPGNVSALINMNEMIRRGYAVGKDDQQRVKAKLTDFFKFEENRIHLREIVHYYGPVRRDLELTAKMLAESKKERERLNAQLAAGEKVELPPEVKAAFERSDNMVLAMGTNDLTTAAKIAREFLSNPTWRNWAPANAVMGEAMAAEGDYVAAEAFFSTAMADGREAPDVVVNNYADVLMNLGRLNEAERLLRKLIAKTDEKEWGPRFTLAEVLTRKSERSKQEEDEVRELVSLVMKYAPAEIVKVMREKRRKGEILK